MEWTAFEQVFGPITVHERIDGAAAQISYMLASAFGDGRKLDLRDFMPQWGAEEEDAKPRQSADSMIAVMRGLQKKKKKRKKKREPRGNVA
jgi:hypothetical protein